jgi:hypothetical protein
MLSARNNIPLFARGTIAADDLDGSQVRTKVARELINKETLST